MSEGESGSGASALKIILIVLGVVFGLGILCCGAYFVGVGVYLVPKVREVQDKQAQTMCANHLRQLGAAWTMTAIEDPDSMSGYDGPATFLRLRRDGQIGPGAEDVFLCPNDPRVAPPLTEAQRSAYDDIDLDDPDPLLCSYAARDFSIHPLDENAGPEPIAACPYHDDGVNILFNDGSVKFKSELDLGIDTEDPDLFGEDTSHPLLRPLRALGD